MPLRRRPRRALRAGAARRRIEAFSVRDGEVAVLIGIATVEQVLVDHAFSLMLLADESATIIGGSGSGATLMLRIETEFSIDGGALAGVYDPEDTGSLGPLVAMHKEVVRLIVMARDGELRLEFVSGMVLTVRPHERYEAWNLWAEGQGGERLWSNFCTPGGFGG